MKKKNAREQPFEELTEMFKTLQEKARTQDCVIQKFQELIQKEGLFSRDVSCFPYPMAAFKQDGELVFVNDSLSEKTGLYLADLSKGKHNILNRITDPNFPTLDAVENVFVGETTFLNCLSDPLAMFIGERSNKKILSPNYQRAIFFPIVDAEGEITHGAAVFMK